MSVNLQNIKDFALFSSLKMDTLEEMARVALLKDFSANTIFQMQDEPCEFVGFVRTGTAVIFRLSPNGNEQIISVLTPGMHFNTVPAMDTNKNVRACIKAISPLSLLLIPVEDFRYLLQTHADLAYLILSDFARRLDHLVKLVDELSLHSVRGRLAQFLLNQTNNDQSSKSWTQDEIAAHLGTVRDVVGRTLRAFIKAGMIERKNGVMVILDRIGLEEEA
ncbi:Crp/Fnr family transcriptional regulator, partial [bacterium]|nr:Crp/Fnr family transcriptional regulator [bacterium]